MRVVIHQKKGAVMQTNINFSSLHANFTTTQWAMGEEIKREEANSIPQSTEDKNKASTSNVESTSKLLNSALSDLQKNIISKAMDKVAQVKEEMLKILDSMGASNKGTSSKPLKLEDLLTKDFSSHNIGGSNSGISITQGFYKSVELSIQATIKGSDGITKKLDLNIKMSESFLSNLQINSKGQSNSKEDKDKVIDPLVIDYEGNGTELSDMKMDFDLDSDGKADQISTLKKGSGFLALDKNNDGKINNGSELFGTKSGNGFADLAQYDENKDGKIDKNDPIYEKLRIWTPNQNGEGQLVGLGEKGIGTIFLNPKESQEMMRGENGDLLGIKQKTADFQRKDGSLGNIHHIDFVAKQNNAQNLPNSINPNQSYLQNLGKNSTSLQALFQSFSFQSQSFSFNALNNAQNGVSKEVSLLWQRVDASFISIQSTQNKEKNTQDSQENPLDTMLKNFDEELYSNLNHLIFKDFNNQGIFENLNSALLNKLLVA